MLYRNTVDKTFFLEMKGKRERKMKNNANDAEGWKHEPKKGRKGGRVEGDDASDTDGCRLCGTRKNTAGK